MRSAGLLRVAIVSLSALAAVDAGYSQERPADDGWSLTVGGGGLYAPAYEGDDTYRLSLLPNVQLNHGDRFFASVQGGVGYSAIATPSFRAGPIARVKFAREEDGNQTFAVTGDDTTDLRGLGDVDTSLELGGFFSYKVGRAMLNAELRQAVSGHEGLVADVGAVWSGRSYPWRQAIIWSFGPRMRVVDDAYNAAYFGVDAVQSAASGLPAFAAGGGVHSYGAGATAILPLGRNSPWAAVVVAGYDQLVGDAGASPLVQERGSADQASAGIFLTYRVL
jgi:outer membrane protein